MLHVCSGIGDRCRHSRRWTFHNSGKMSSILLLPCYKSSSVVCVTRSWCYCINVLGKNYLGQWNWNRVVDNWKGRWMLPNGFAGHSYFAICNFMLGDNVGTIQRRRIGGGRNVRLPVPPRTLEQLEDGVHVVSRQTHGRNLVARHPGL